MESFTTDLLHDIIDNGRLDAEYLIRTLMKITNSTTGHFFVNEDDHTVCRYTTGGYTVGQIYNIVNLPPYEECFDVAYRTDTIAIMCLSNASVLEPPNLDATRRQDLHDTISLGLRLEMMSTSHYEFTQCLTSTVKGLVQKSITSTGIDTNTLYDSLGKIIELMNNAADYVALDTEKTRLDVRKINVRNFMNAVVKGINDTLVMTDLTIDKTVPEVLVIDPSKIQQILRTVISKIGSVSKLTIQVTATVKGVSEIFLNFVIKVTESAKAVDLKNVLMTSNNSMDSLGIRIVKKLVQLMHGDLRIGQDNIHITTKCDTLSQFVNKDILISLADKDVSKKLTKWLSDNGSIVLEIDMMYVTKVASDKYSLAIIDEDSTLYRDVARKLSSLNIPFLTYKPVMTQPEAFGFISRAMLYDEFISRCAQVML